VDKTTTLTIGAALSGVILFCALVFLGAQSCCNNTLLDEKDEKQKPQRPLSYNSMTPSILGIYTTTEVTQQTSDMSPFIYSRRINASTVVVEDFSEQPKEKPMQPKI
jgi:hypothetical protein